MCVLSTSTSVHCIYNTAVGVIPVTKIDFYSTNSSDNTPVKIITDVESIHIRKNYIVIKNLNYDYALITVEDDLSDYLCFNLGFALDNLKDQETDIYVTGFPGEDFGNMYTGFGNIVECYDQRLKYNTDTTGGQSGSPVYTITTFQNKVYYTVIAIHTHSGNYGVRITTDVLHFYYNNPNL